MEAEYIEALRFYFSDWSKSPIDDIIIQMHSDPNHGTSLCNFILKTQWGTLSDYTLNSNTYCMSQYQQSELNYKWKPEVEKLTNNFAGTDFSGTVNTG